MRDSSSGEARSLAAAVVVVVVVGASGVKFVVPDAAGLFVGAVVVM